VAEDITYHSFWASTSGAKLMSCLISAYSGPYFVSDSATILLGKNTMMRKAIRGHLENNPNLERLLPHIKQNVGFVFTDGELPDIREKILSNKVPAAARAGALAPVSCTVPAQVTPLGPEKTSFFQALQIPTKISRGNIEILVSSIKIKMVNARSNLKHVCCFFDIAFK